MKPWCEAPTGMTLAITMKRYDGAFAGYRYNLTNNAWEASPSYADSRIALVEGTSEYVGYYEAASDINTTALGSPASNVRFFVHNENASNRVEAIIDVPIVNGEIPTGSNILASTLLDGTTLGVAILNILAKLNGASSVSGFDVTYKAPGDGVDTFSETLSSSVAGQRTSTSLRSS